MPPIPKITVEGLITPRKKSAKTDPEVLSDESLMTLARLIGPHGLQFAMLLNIPTTTIVKAQLKCEDKGQGETDVIIKALLYWKHMRTTAKPKDKVNDLVRALKMLPDREEWANVVSDRYKDNLDLTADCFPAS